MRLQILALLFLVGCKSTPGQQQAEQKPPNSNCSNAETWSAWNDRMQQAAARGDGEGPAEHQARVRNLEEEGQLLARSSDCTQVDKAWQAYFESNPGNRSQTMAALMASFETCPCIAGERASAAGASAAGATAAGATEPAEVQTVAPTVGSYSPPLSAAESAYRRAEEAQEAVSDISDFDFEYDLSSASHAEKKKALDEWIQRKEAAIESFVEGADEAGRLARGEGNRIVDRDLLRMKGLVFRAYAGDLEFAFQEADIPKPTQKPPWRPYYQQARAMFEQCKALETPDEKEFGCQVALDSMDRDQE